MPTNNITRMLDAKKIPYTAFELPPEKLGAIETARLLGVPLEQVFKTIVVKREGKGKPILAVVPGTSEVDLKKIGKGPGREEALPGHRARGRADHWFAGGWYFTPGIAQQGVPGGIEFQFRKLY